MRLGETEVKFSAEIKPQAKTKIIEIWKSKMNQGNFAAK